MTYDQIFNRFNDLESELREQGALREDIISVLQDLINVLEEEEDE